MATLNKEIIKSCIDNLYKLKYIKLEEAVQSLASGGYRRKSGSIANRGGVYIFWWTGKKTKLYSCNRKWKFQGPNKKKIQVEITNEWISVRKNSYIPLYVGKNADNLSNRIGQHLMLGTEVCIKKRNAHRNIRYPTTSCQLRAGVDFLFPDIKDTRKLIVNNIGISYVELHGDAQAINRFYLEDQAIGKLYPILNADVER